LQRFQKHAKIHETKKMISEAAKIHKIKQKTKTTKNIKKQNMPPRRET